MIAPLCDLLLDEVAPGSSIGTVVADAEFDSERNHRHIREQIGAEYHSS